MFYGLKKTTRLRRERAAVVVFSVEDTGRLCHAHPIYALTLALLNGRRSEGELLEILAQLLSLPAEGSEALLSKMLADFADFVDGSPTPADTSHRYEPIDYLYRPAGAPMSRLSGPVGIAWLVTERCPYDCIYCCIRTLPAGAPPEDELTTEEARRFLEDCVATGVESMIFHGGEPFLRPDLPELMGFLLSHGVHVMTSTKLRLREGVVARLAEIGLAELQLSVDSPTSEIADRMVRQPNYLDRAYHNVALLLRHGIAPRVNTVVTSENVAGIPRLVREMTAAGVRRFALANYIRSPHKHDDRLFPRHDELVRMSEEVERIAASSDGEVRVEMCSLVSPREASLACDEYSRCSGGKSGLAVGANGKVSICDRLLADDDAIVGDVRQSSLADIWNGEKLKRLLAPSEEDFAGTACASCGLKAMCDERIRCYYRSKQIARRLFAPDYLCGRLPPPPIRFF